MTERERGRSNAGEGWVRGGGMTIACEGCWQRGGNGRLSSSFEGEPWQLIDVSLCSWTSVRGPGAPGGPSEGTVREVGADASGVLERDPSEEDPPEVERHHHQDREDREDEGGLDQAWPRGNRSGSRERTIAGSLGEDLARDLAVLLRLPWTGRTPTRRPRRSARRGRGASPRSLRRPGWRSRSAAHRPHEAPFAA